MNTKKGQEEMVGFVVIVILVTVIGIVFIAIYARQTPTPYASRDASNFIHSALLQATICEEVVEHTDNLKELIDACYLKKQCLNGKPACEVLTSTLKELFESGFNIDPEGKFKGYEIRITSGSTSELLVMPQLKEGLTTSTIAESKVQFPSKSNAENLNVVVRVYS